MKPKYMGLGKAVLGINLQIIDHRSWYRLTCYVSILSTLLARKSIAFIPVLEIRIASWSKLQNSPS